MSNNIPLDFQNRCVECDEPAVWCVQTISRIYPYNPITGDFGEPIELDDQNFDADWYCAECGKKYLGVQ